MNPSRDPTDPDERLRAALRARAGDGKLPDGFVARLMRDLPPRHEPPEGPTWRLSGSAPGLTLGRAAGLAAALSAGLVVVVVTVLVVTAARPDLMAGPGLRETATPSLASDASTSPSPSSTASSSLSSTSSIPPPSPRSGLVGASSARYDDGIPRAFDGRPVLRSSAADAQAKAATDDTPFLIGGWIDAFPPGTVMSCPFDANTTWLNDCPPTTLHEVAGKAGSTLAVPVSFHFVRDQATTGPAVLEVHVHDPRAADCGSQAPACAAAMIVDRILWTGDGATDPRPLTIDAVRPIVTALQPKAVLEAGIDSSDGCYQPPSSWFYAVPNAPETTPSIVSVALESSPAARERAVPQAAGAAAALTSAAICVRSGTGIHGTWTWVAYRDVAVANVAVSVRTSLAPTAAERSFIERLAAALQRAATAEASAAATAAP